MMSDAASIIQSGNLYMFTMGNPVMFADPSGLSAEMTRLIIGRFGLLNGTSIAWSVSNINNMARSRANAMAEDLGLGKYERRHVGRGRTADIFIPDDFHNIVDAYRHFIGNFYMTRELGVEVASFVSNMNEFITLRDYGNLLSHNLEAGWVSAMVTRAVLQDIWNDAVGRSIAMSHPHLNSSQAFNLALSQGRLITNAYDIFLTLGIDHLIPRDGNNDRTDWRVRMMWNFNDQTFIFTDPDGNNSVTVRL